MDKKHNLKNEKYLSLNEYNQREKTNDKSPFTLLPIILIVAIILFMILATFSIFEYVEEEYSMYQYVVIGFLVSLLIVIFIIHFNGKNKDQRPLLLTKKTNEFTIVNTLEEETLDVSNSVKEEVIIKKSVVKK